MNQYEEFLTKINDYFQYAEVISKGNIISAYDLLAILHLRLMELYNIIYNKKDLYKKINAYYKNRNLPSFFLSRLVKAITPTVEFTNTQVEDGTARFYIRLKNSSNYGHLEICKEYGTNNLYFKDTQEVDKDFAEFFKEEILKLLQDIEEFYNIFKLSLPTNDNIPGSGAIEEKIDDDFLSLVISYDTYGFLSYDISILKTIDLEDIYHRIWLDKESINDFVNRHVEELLKRIPIQISDLKDSTQKIVSDYYELNKSSLKELKLNKRDKYGRV